MLSFIIPVYNFNCLRLVTDLQIQCEELQAEYGEENFCYEILVGEDGSSDEACIKKNQLIELLPNTQYITWSCNVGRAHCCNLLFQKVSYPWVILIDADAKVCSDDFVRTYWRHRKSASVVVGSISTPTTAPRGHELRLKYEKSATALRTLSYRNAHPSRYFSTFNILFGKDVLQKLSFDERCTEYGYEDAFMGIQLQELGYSILHIDNPLLHTGINSNVEFLRNTEASLRMLKKLGTPMTSYSSVSRLYTWLDSRWFGTIMGKILILSLPFLKWHLLSRFPTLVGFQLYKLSYYYKLHQTK